MDKILENTLLFDYYSSLLTKKQYDTYEMYFNEDFTIQEIADIQHTSKQAVSDLLKRTSKNLKDIEEKLKLVKRHEEIRTNIQTLFEKIEKTELREDIEIENIKISIFDLL